MYLEAGCQYNSGGLMVRVVLRLLHLLQLQNKLLLEKNENIFPMNYLLIGLNGGNYHALMTFLQCHNFI